MANWNDVIKQYKILQENKYNTYIANNRMPLTPELNNKFIRTSTIEALNELRKQFLEDYSQIFNRNVIVYYSGFLKIRNDNADLFVGDNDINGFMSAVCGIDKSKGLDLFLHTPGGSISAAEAIVDYLKNIFHDDIRVVIPQIAMSAGTMIACCAKEIIMGKQSSLGPTDPQIRGVPTHGVLEEFEQAMNEVLKNNNKILLWREIVSKYHPTFLGECKKAIQLSSDLVIKWLETGMFKGLPDAKKKAKAIVEKHLNNHKTSKTHDRHFNLDTCKSFGLNIYEMEQNNVMQDKILSIHHATMLTIDVLNSPKIIQSQENNPWIVTFN